MKITERNIAAYNAWRHLMAIAGYEGEIARHERALEKYSEATVPFFYGQDFDREPEVWELDESQYTDDDWADVWEL